MLSHDQLKSHKVCPCSHATHIGTNNQVPHILEILFFMYENSIKTILINSEFAIMAMQAPPKEAK